MWSFGIIVDLDINECLASCDVSGGLERRVGSPSRVACRGWDVRS